LLNILGILIAIGILITTFNWDTFWGLVIPMGIVVSYNIFEWTQKSYQLIVKSFDTIENPNNIKESTSATDIEFKLPEMINIKGEEEENV